MLARYDFLQRGGCRPRVGSPAGLAARRQPPAFAQAMGLIMARAQLAPAPREAKGGDPGNEARGSFQHQFRLFFGSPNASCALLSTSSIASFALAVSSSSSLKPP